MAPNILHCPHCSKQIKFIGINGSSRSSSWRSFESTAADVITTRIPPKNWLGSLWYFLRGHQWAGPDPEPGPGDVTIYAEIKTPDKAEWFLDRLDSRITLQELWAVARVICWEKSRWSRANLVRPVGPLTQPKFYIFCDDFKKLNYNFVKSNNHVEMTPKGETFLTAVLEKYPNKPI